MSARKIPVSDTRAPGSGIPPYKPITKVPAVSATKSAIKLAEDAEKQTIKGTPSLPGPSRTPVTKRLNPSRTGRVAPSKPLQSEKGPSAPGWNSAAGSAIPAVKLQVQTKPNQVPGEASTSETVPGAPSAPVANDCTGVPTSNAPGRVPPVSVPMSSTAAASGHPGVPAVTDGKKGDSDMSSPSEAPGVPCQELSGVPYSGNDTELETPALAAANKRIFDLSRELELEKQAKNKFMVECAALKVETRSHKMEIDDLKQPRHGLAHERAKVIKEQKLLMEQRDAVEERADELERKLKGIADAPRMAKEKADEESRQSIIHNIMRDDKIALLEEERSDPIKAADCLKKELFKSQMHMTNKQARTLELAQQMKMVLRGSGSK